MSAIEGRPAGLTLALAAVGLALAGPARADLTVYEHDGFQGRSFSAQRSADNFVRRDFNDAASSVVVTGGSWQLCEDADFAGRCVVLRPGRYPSLTAIGLNDRVSSARPVADEPTRRDADGRAEPAADYRRRPGERLYEANVTASHAVFGAPEQRCWVEREQVEPQRGRVNTPAVVLGAVIGGILGHQVGGGVGRGVATAGGAVAGAAVGSQIGRGPGRAGGTQDVQKCADAPGPVKPAYWDVSYRFRGVEHRMQMTHAPGNTITVNRAGEPRG